MATTLVHAGTVSVNGAAIYHEIRGDGPPVVFITGASGDAGWYEQVAELLADAYTVVTYDRRGNSRSSKPEGWATTSIAEQADDCAALIEALGLEHPVVFGNSSGAVILLGLIERHANALRGAVVHEPGLPSRSPVADEFAQAFAKVLEALTTDGPERAVDLTARLINGDAAWEATPADLRSRVCKNGDVLFGLETPSFATFVPDTEVLSSLPIPVHAAYGEETAGTWLKLCVEGAKSIAQTTGGSLHVFPGGHDAFFERPAEFAEALRPILASILSEPAGAPAPRRQAMRPKVGVVLPANGDWSELRDLASFAEGIGVDTVWVPDGFSDGHLEAWTLVSAIAASTERVGLGVYMLNASLRDPTLLAKMTATLERIAPGRVRILLGTGWDRTDYEALETDFPAPEARTAGTRRAVKMLKERTGASVEVAGVTDELMRIVAARADGWALSADALDVFFERAALLRELCADIGRPFEDLRLSCTVPCVEGALDRVADLSAHGMDEFRLVLSDGRGDRDRLKRVVRDLASRPT